jgi:hypothetical protein
VAKICPRCGIAVSKGEANHDYVCIETMLMALYQVGVKRGLEGEGNSGSFDDQGAELLGDVLALAWSWREAAQGRGAGANPATLMPAASRPRLAQDQDLDTQVASFLAWENIGWFEGMPVSGESAWQDPRVIRRRFSTRYDDAMVVMRHPLLRPYQVYQVHRIHHNQWEWHVSTKNRDGELEAVVRERTAPLAVCLAALKLAGAAAGRGSLVG